MGWLFVAGQTPAGEGPDAHIERHLALRRAGWELVGAHRSRWGERPGELAVDLLHRLRSPL